MQLALRQAPAVIASDVRLVEGSGPRAVEKIRAEMGEIPVLFITGSPKACQSPDPLGIVLVKPVSIQQLTTAFCEIAPRQEPTLATYSRVVR